MSADRPDTAGLVITQLHKHYGPTEILKGIDLHIRPGTVHALLGANGAGKSTLIKCISGSTPWSAGTVTLDGSVLSNLTPAAAQACRIATIHQHLSLIDSLSLSDNIFLGRELKTGPWIKRGEQRKVSRNLLRQFGVTESPDTLVSKIGAGHRQLVEITKAWAEGDIRVLILDEPTASLSSEESEVLFREVERMKSAGVCIIYVTHRLGEVFRLADDITIMRNGEVALTGSTRDVRPDRVIQALSGTPAHGATTPYPSESPAETVLTVDSLVGPRFGPVSLAARRGEIVGLFGALGSGRSSLLETMAGLYRPDSGRVLVNGSHYLARNPRDALAQRVAIIPGDRGQQGLWPSQSALFNALLPWLHTFSRWGLRSPRREHETYIQLADALEVTPPDPQVPVAQLSGGNAQKVLVSRWLHASNELDVLLIDEPTSGVDIRARAQIHAALRAATDQGLAVLMSSSDADELSQFADRVLVFDQGRIVAELRGETITPDALLQAAHQIEHHSAPSPHFPTRNP